MSYVVMARGMEWNDSSYELAGLDQKFGNPVRHFENKKDAYKKCLELSIEYLKGFDWVYEFGAGDVFREFTPEIRNLLEKCKYDRKTYEMKKNMPDDYYKTLLKHFEPEYFPYYIIEIEDD